MIYRGSPNHDYLPIKTSNTLYDCMVSLTTVGTFAYGCDPGLSQESCQLTQGQWPGEILDVRCSLCVCTHSLQQ